MGIQIQPCCCAGTLYYISGSPPKIFVYSNLRNYISGTVYDLAYINDVNGCLFIDSNTGYVFFADSSGGATPTWNLNRCNLDGTGLTTIATMGTYSTFSNPSSNTVRFSLDRLNQKIYFTFNAPSNSTPGSNLNPSDPAFNGNYQTIKCCDYNGSPQTFSYTGSAFNFCLACDGDSGYVFWSEIINEPDTISGPPHTGTNYSKIKRSDLTGSPGSTTILFSSVWPDFFDGTEYWALATDTNLNVLFRVESVSDAGHGGEYARSISMSDYNAGSDTVGPGLYLSPFPSSNLSVDQKSNYLLYNNRLSSTGISEVGYTGIGFNSNGGDYPVPLVGSRQGYDVHNP